MKKTTLTILLFVFVSVNIFSQSTQMTSIRDGWQGIIPIKSNRTEVEKELGSQKEAKGHYSVYETDEVIIEIAYSAEPCSERALGTWNIPQDRVLFYTVKPKKELLVSTLNWDTNKFQRLGSKHQLDSLFEYFNSEEGISLIGALGQNGQEVVTVIVYSTGKKYDHLKCK